MSPGPHLLDHVKATVVKGTYYYNNPNFITMHAIRLIGVAFSHNQNVKAQPFLKDIHCFTVG